MKTPRERKPWSAARRAAYDLFHEHRRRAHARAFAFGEAKPVSPSIT